MSFQRLVELAGRLNGDLTPYEIDNCKNVTFVFGVDNCVGNVLYFCLKLKREERRNAIKIVECNLQLLAHNGSCFDTWILINNLPCDKHIVDIIKNGKGIISSSVFIGYI